MNIKLALKDLKIAKQKIDDAKFNYWRISRKIGAEFRKQRIAEGISLRKMAKKLHILPAYLSDMERGNRIFKINN